MFPSSMMSLVSLLLAPLAFASPILDPRAGAPISQQKINVTELTQCGIANISWTGPGTEPYSLMIGQGGFYVGIEEVAKYENITGNAVYWIVDQDFSKSLIFEIVDADNQVTYIQNQVVGPPANDTSPPNVEVNGTLTCPMGTGLVNATLFEAYKNGTMFPGGNGTTKAPIPGTY